MSTTQVQSVSVIPTTSNACNAGCKYCVARMTPGNIDGEVVWVPRKRVANLLYYGSRGGAMTAIITSKGEPTLDMRRDIGKFLTRVEMCASAIPQVDLHTNGMVLNRGAIEELRDAGVNMVTLSVGSFEPAKNAYLMGVEVDYKRLIGMLNEAGICVRISTVCTSANVHSAGAARTHILAARNLGADMVVLRECWMPERLVDDVRSTREVAEWIAENHTSAAELERDLIDKTLYASVVRKLPWGANVYDVGGVNVTFARCDETHDDGFYKSIQLVPHCYPSGCIGWRMRGSWGRTGDTLG